MTQRARHEGQVDQLVHELVDALQDDWVAIPSMTTPAAAVSGTWDRAVNRELIRDALLELVGTPGVKVVDGDMTHELATREELLRHLDAEWPDDGSPIERDVGWLVERDFELRQRGDSSD